MTNEEALQLVKAGFSADEIRAFGWSPEPPKEEPKDNGGNADDQNTQPGADDNASNGAALPSEVSETIKGLTETVNSLTETVKAMQVANQKNARKTKNDNAPKSADEVIKGFIENM